MTTDMFRWNFTGANNLLKVSEFKFGGIYMRPIFKSLHNKENATFSKILLVSEEKVRDLYLH